MRRIFLAVFTISLLNANAQQQVLSVEEAVANALVKNYDIQLVRNDSSAFALDNKYANTVLFPQLNGTVTKLWNNNDQRQRLLDGTKREGNGVRSTNLVASVNLNWTLFDGLKMFATREKYAEFQRLGELSVRNQVVNTVAAVVNNYYNIVQQKQQLKAIEEQMSISEERVKLADKKLSVGLGSKPELLQARVDLNAFKAAQLRQQTLIAQLREQLNQLTGQQISTMYDVTDSIPIDLDLQYGNLYATFEKTNPTLQIAQKNIDITKLTLKERKGDLWPVISFNSAYNFSRTDNITVVNPITQPLYNMNRGLNYGFGATVPIFNGFNARRLIKHAQLDIQYQQLTFENQRTLVDLGIANAFKDYEYQKKALLLEEDNIQLAKENVTIALERFRQGVSTYLELREAQISLADAYNRLIAARYNTKVAETELLRLKGDILR
jgi:outer membrane protein